MTSPELEGFIRRPHSELPPVSGERECPCCEFSIGSRACESRQMAYTAANGKTCTVCTPECSNFDHSAHAERLQTILAKKNEPAEEPEVEEVNPMDMKFDRELPPGAKVTRSGRVWVGGQEKLPCPKCKDGWMTSVSKACLNCAPKKGRFSGQEGKERAATMRQAKAAKHSPEPKATPPHVTHPPIPHAACESPIVVEALTADLEHFAQLYAARIRARAAEILALEVTP